jgi:capsular polysaccharide biosynthesis protein
LRPRHSSQRIYSGSDLRVSEIEVRQLPTNILSSIWRHKVVIVASALIGLLIGLFISWLQPPSYTAQSQVFLSSPAPFNALDDGGSSDPSRYLVQQATLMTSAPLLRSAITAGATASNTAELGESLDVVASDEADVITVRATGDDADQASSRVDGVVAAYRQYQKAEVATQLAAVSKLGTPATKAVAAQRAAVFGDGVELVEQASVSKDSTAIGNASVLAVVGVLASLGYAAAKDARSAARMARYASHRPTVSGIFALSEDDSATAPDADAAGATRPLTRRGTRVAPPTVTSRTARSRPRPVPHDTRLGEDRHASSDQISGAAPVEPRGGWLDWERTNQ